MTPTGWTIRQRVLLLALVPAAVIAVLLTLYYAISGLDGLDAQLRQRGQATVRYLAPACEYGVIAGDRVGLQALAQAAMQQSDVRAVMVLDMEGQPMALSGRATQSPNQVASQGRGGLLQSQGKGWIGFAAPIRRAEVALDDLDLSAPTGARSPGTEAGGERIGVAYVEIGTDDLAAQKHRFLLRAVLLFVLVMGATSLFALRVARSFSRPVSRLVGAVRAMAAGSLETRVPNVSEGELGQLEQGFNHMAERLENNYHIQQERIAAATTQLAYQASHDPLTGLVNRREFERRILEVLATASPDNSHVLCYLDLDRFKAVNDTCGHGAGDELLRQITRLLQERLREGDVLGRLGGDEFGVLLENCPVSDALQVAENLRCLVQDFRFQWNQQLFSIGASIGLVALDGTLGTLEEVLSAVDNACYAAKAQGRNRVVQFQLDGRELMQRQADMGWASRLQRGFQENRFLLFAQSLVPLQGAQDGDLRYEVFPCLLEDGGTVIPAAAFLPSAERFELLAPLDRWLIEAACTGLERLKERFPGRRACCCIDLSLQSLEQTQLLTFIRERLTSHGLEPAQLCFEISEDLVGRDGPRVRDFAAQARALGCQLALDDFGSGLSSFAYLKELPLSWVKLDAKLTRELSSNPISSSLIRAVQSICRTLGLQVVATRVEGEGTFLALQEEGVDWGQGYWFGPARLFDDWLVDLDGPGRDGNSAA